MKKHNREQENSKPEKHSWFKSKKDEVKQEMISVASLMSEKIVAASIDADKQNALIEQTLQEIGDETWQS